MIKFIKRFLKSIDDSVKLQKKKAQESKIDAEHSKIIDVVSVRKTTRLKGKKHISVEVIKIKRVDNGHVSEIVRDCESRYAPVYDTYLMQKGYKIRLNRFEIKDADSKYPSTQYSWETSGVNVTEVYQQAFLGKIDGKLRIRSIIRYVDMPYPVLIKEQKYYHENDEKISIKDIMLSEIFLVGNLKLFVRNNSSGFEYLTKPKITISSDSPRGQILYDSRFPGESYKELTHLSV